MIEEKRIFLEFLKKRHLKLTSQREIIFHSFLKTDGHLSVDDLYEIIRKQNSRIGRATVFRTLKLLSEAGLAKGIEFGDRITRYEHEYGHQHHDHLICLRCGIYIEVKEPRIEKLQKNLCSRYGFLPQRHKLQIFGICKRCRKPH